MPPTSTPARRWLMSGPRSRPDRPGHRCRITRPARRVVRRSGRAFVEAGGHAPIRVPAFEPFVGRPSWSRQAAPGSSSTRQRPCTVRAAPSMTPRDRIALAKRVPASRAASIVSASSAGTATVTSRSPRSLSSSRTQADSRRMPGCFDIDRVRDEGRGGVGRRGGSCEHRDRIRNPERVRSALPPAGRHAAHGGAGRHLDARAGDRLAQRRHHAHRQACPGPEVQGDVAAVVHVRVLDAGPRREHRHGLVGDRAGDRGHRRDEPVRAGPYRGDHAACNGPGRHCALRGLGAAQARELARQLAEPVGEHSDQRPACVLDRVSGAAGAHDQVDRTVLQEEPIPGQPRCRCAVREPGPAQAGRRRPAAAAGRGLHRRGVSGYIVRHRIHRGVTHDSDAAGGSLLHGAGLERTGLHRHRQRAIPSRRGGYSVPRIPASGGMTADTPGLHPAPLPPARERSPLRFRSMRT